MLCIRCGAPGATDAGLCRACGEPTFDFSIDPDDRLSRDETTPQHEPDLAVLPAQPINKGNFFASFWRGDYKLPFSYWIVGFLGSLVLRVVIKVVQSLDQVRDFGARATGAAILGVYAIAIVATVWQLGGIWNSASKHKSRGGSGFWAGAAKVAVVIGLLRVISELAIHGVPVIKEGVHLLAGADDVPAYQLHLLHNGTELELTGGIPYGTTDAVRVVLDASPSVKVIRLNSLGGRVGEANKLGRLIRERQLITYTPADCVSACTIAFLSGRERYLGEQGRLGFHSAGIGGLDGKEFRALNEEMRRTMLERNVPVDFVNRALSTSTHSMWFPTQEELIEARVIDGVVARSARHDAAS